MGESIPFPDSSPQAGFGPRTRRWQGAMRRLHDLIAKPWAWLSSGCNPNRRTVDAIAAAGFDTGLRSIPRTLVPPHAHLICKDLPH
jgi:hypothetical protein